MVQDDSRVGVPSPYSAFARNSKGGVNSWVLLMRLHKSYAYRKTFALSLPVDGLRMIGPCDKLRQNGVC